ncbi:glycosyltransferase [bacterium]|nr:glycosyltransferase [bacterium]
MQNSKVKVSIIIPVYKVEKYIHNCMGTILSQTLKDIEVILVDDGSPDNCGKICDDYAKQDSRVKVIHQTNGRQGKARNNGALIAKGEYIGFVDSDDWIFPDMYRELYEKAKKTDADIVMCDYSRCRFVGDKISKKSKIDKVFLEKEVFDVGTLSNIPSRKSFFCVAVCWNKIFKRDFYLKNIKFPENMIFEDTPVMFSAFMKAKRISVVNKKLYCYRITNQNSSSLSKDSRVLDLFKSVNLTLDNLEYLDYNHFQCFVVTSIIRDCIHHLRGLRGVVRHQYVLQLNDVVNKIKELDLYKFISLKDKIRLYLIMKGFKCLNII